MKGLAPFGVAMLLLAAVPLAILANAIRVAAVVPLPVLDAGAPHLILGWLIFVACLVALIFVHRLLNTVWVRSHA